MQIDEFRAYCLSKPATSEELPFGPDTLVFKVMGKIFAICNIDFFDTVNLKCDPEYAVELRERYPQSIKPGYHMNKKHWNTVEARERIDPRLFRQLVDHSYDCVVATLPKSKRPKKDDMQ